MYSLCYFLFVVVTQGGTWLWCKGEHRCGARGGTCMVVRQGGTQGKKIANPINENENHTIWLLKEVHHEKPNQSLSEIIVIQVVLCTIIVPGLMKKDPPPVYNQPTGLRSWLWMGTRSFQNTSSRHPNYQLGLWHLSCL